MATFLSNGQVLDRRRLLGRVVDDQFDRMFRPRFVHAWKGTCDVARGPRPVRDYIDRRGSRDVLSVLKSAEFCADFCAMKPSGISQRCPGSVVRRWVVRASRENPAGLGGAPLRSLRALRLCVIGSAASASPPPESRARRTVRMGSGTDHAEAQSTQRAQRRSTQSCRIFS